MSAQVEAVSSIGRKQSLQAAHLRDIVQRPNVGRRHGGSRAPPCGSGGEQAAAHGWGGGWACGASTTLTESGTPRQGLGRPEMGGVEQWRTKPNRGACRSRSAHRSERSRSDRRLLQQDQGAQVQCGRSWAGRQLPGGGCATRASLTAVLVLLKACWGGPEPRPVVSMSLLTRGFLV